jgi:hypothetical protein
MAGFEVITYGRFWVTAEEERKVTLSYVIVKSTHLDSLQAEQN